MATYMIEHLKSNKGYKAGTIIKAGTVIAQAGLTGWVDASGHLMHICKCSEDNKIIEDFYRGGNACYVDCTIQDPKDLIPLFKNKTIKGSWGNSGNEHGYKISDGVAYVSPKVHLGGDFQFMDGKIDIVLTKDIKITDCRDAGDFGNAIAFMICPESPQDAPESTPPPTSTTNTPKTFKAVRSGKTQDNGTFYFDEKYYNDFKDKYQNYAAVDTKGNTWAATTTWTTVYAPSGSTSTPAPAPSKTVKGYSFNECYGYHPQTGDLCWFDIELYGSTQDDICFLLSNLTKDGSDIYVLKANASGYVKNTKFRKIKTTFYTDGTKK